MPVEVTGRDKCGHQAGGVFEQLIHEIEMEVPPREIPASIVIDVTALPLDGVIRIADVQSLSAGLAPSPEEVIVTIAQPRIEVGPLRERWRRKPPRWKWSRRARRRKRRSSAL